MYAGNPSRLSILFLQLLIDLLRHHARRLAAIRSDQQFQPVGRPSAEIRPNVPKNRRILQLAAIIERAEQYEIDERPRNGNGHLTASQYARLGMGEDGLIRDFPDERWYRRPGPRPALLNMHWMPDSTPCQRKNSKSVTVGKSDARLSAQTNPARPDPRHVALPRGGPFPTSSTALHSRPARAASRGRTRAASRGRAASRAGSPRVIAHPRLPQIRA